LWTALKALLRLIFQDEPGLLYPDVLKPESAPTSASFAEYDSAMAQAMRRTQPFHEAYCIANKLQAVDITLG
jgi:hypothetical protein